MKLHIRALALILLLALLVFGCSGPSGENQKKLGKKTVENLKVEDIRGDGGDGLMLSWKPLPKESRVQEYRIYRGVHPDTLFFVTAVQVNVKTGVGTDEMFYSDSGYNPLVSLDSPRKLKNERGAKGSILYRGVPRDAEIMARLSESYNLYTQMKSKDFYYRTKKTKSADPEDEGIYAGVKFNQQTILASLKSVGSTPEPINYYYTVVPVNERGQYLGIPKPVSGTPVDDAPLASPGLYCAALEDLQELRFEWEYPISHSDIQAYEILMVRDPEVPSRENAIPVASGPVGGGALKNNCVVPLAQFTQMGIPLSWENLKEAHFAIIFSDGSRNQSPFSEAAQPLLTHSRDLPQVPVFRVEDKPMDKGDRISVIWQEPVVSITKTSSVNSSGTKLKINYEINKTDSQKLNNIYFDFFEPGNDKPFTTINEFHQDNIIHLKLPERYSLKGNKMPQDSLKVRITIATQPYKINTKNGRIIYEKSRLVENYELVQYLKPDPVMVAYMPTRQLFLNGQDVSSMQNVVYRKGYRGSAFTQVKTNTSYENNLDVTVNYLANVGQPVLGFNFVKNDTLHTYMGGQRFSRKLKDGEKALDLALLPSQIDFTLDTESKSTLSTSIYLDEAKNTVQNLKKDLQEKKAELEKNKKALTDPNTERALTLATKVESDEKQIEALQAKIEAYEKNPLFQKALKAKSSRSMMKLVASVREPEQRKHNYSMFRTNGKGLFSEAVPDTLNEDYVYYSPISNWFDWNKLLSLFAVIIFGAMVVIFVNLAKKGKDLYMRPIAGLQEIDNAIGRATEMGRPMLYCMGNGGLSDVATLASMGILSLVARKAAEYDTKLIVPCYDYIVMPIAQEIVREAHYAVGRPDSYEKDNVFYLTSVQFAYVAGVNGIMIRERMATNFFMGYFAAEALLMTETGNAVGAVQIAGSDAITQIPFFITTCDYTLIGEELYAASAYLNREPMLLGTLKAQDYFKFLILVFIIAGTVLASFQMTGLMQFFPLK